MRKPTKLKPTDIPALYEQHGSLRAIARHKNLQYRTVQRLYARAVEAGLVEPLVLGKKTRAHQKRPVIRQRVKALKTKRTRHAAYILTCAQNNTKLHEPTWRNLLAYAKHTGAQIFVSTFLYARRSAWHGYTDKGAADPVNTGRDRNKIWYEPELVPYFNNDRVEIAKGLVWCGELNIIPTASDPLSDLEVYTGRASMVAPHVKLAMESIASVGGGGTKLNYTTGTVTLRNYIQRKEGFKGEFHHCYGALFVEVDDDGHWWARQLNADSDGVIHDLDIKIADSKVTEGHRVEAITMGDVHVAQIDEPVRDATWGEGGMVDVLRPKFQFIHDVLDFYSRSHHAIKDPYKMFQRHVLRKDNVEREVRDVADFLAWIKRDECLTVVVNSNHDRHLARWLAENDGRKDPVNAKFWSWLNSKVMDYISNTGEQPDHLPFVIHTLFPKFDEVNGVHFIKPKTSFIICKKNGGGIECGLHFDQGAGGSKGSVRQFAKSIGRRSNGGHSHVASIFWGAWQAGTHSLLDLDYIGPLNACTHTDIITHENGKRQMVTFYAGKWRA